MVKESIWRSLPSDPWVSGQGAMNLKAAFEWLATHVGPPVLPDRTLDSQGEEDTYTDGGSSNMVQGI